MADPEVTARRTAAVNAACSLADLAPHVGEEASAGVPALAHALYWAWAAQYYEYARKALKEFIAAPYDEPLTPDIAAMRAAAGCRDMANNAALSTMPDVACLIGAVTESLPVRPDSPVDRICRRAGERATARIAEAR